MRPSEPALTFVNLPLLSSRSPTARYLDTNHNALFRVCAGAVASDERRCFVREWHATHTRAQGRILSKYRSNLDAAGDTADLLNHPDQAARAWICHAPFLAISSTHGSRIHKCSCPFCPRMARRAYACTRRNNPQMLVHVRVRVRMHACV